MRAGLVLVVAGCASAGGRAAEPLAEPEDRRVHRVEGRVVTMDDATSGHIEWTDGLCEGSKYRGGIERDLPSGRGTWFPARGHYLSIAGTFSGLTITGSASATLRQATQQV